MSGEEKGDSVQGLQATPRGVWTALSYLLYFCPSAVGLTSFPELPLQGTRAECMWIPQSSCHWFFGPEHTMPLPPSHPQAHPDPQLSRVLRTLYTLTIRIGFIDGDHALGLRKEDREKHWGREKGGKHLRPARDASLKGARAKVKTP